MDDKKQDEHVADAVKNEMDNWAKTVYQRICDLEKELKEEKDEKEKVKKLMEKLEQEKKTMESDMKEELELLAEKENEVVLLSKKVEQMEEREKKSEEKIIEMNKEIKALKTVQEEQAKKFGNEKATMQDQIKSVTGENKKLNTENAKFNEENKKLHMKLDAYKKLLKPFNTQLNKLLEN